MNSPSLSRGILVFVSDMLEGYLIAIAENGPINEPLSAMANSQDM